MENTNPLFLLPVDYAKKQKSLTMRKNIFNLFLRIVCAGRGRGVLASNLRSKAFFNVCRYNLSQTTRKARGGQIWGLRGEV